jgi:hypothetical protein
MTTPTVPVTVDLAAMGGPALAGITVRATLDGNEVYTGIVVSKRVEAVTDASGVAILNMFPNAPSPTGLGTQGTTYHITALVPGGRGVSVQARVPNLACRLENILVLDDDEPVDVSAAELALLQAQAAVTVVAAGAAAASASAALADADRVQTAADRVQTGLDRVATAADRVQTGLDRTQTAADRVQTGADRSAASASATAAASSQAQAAAIVLGNFMQTGTGAVSRPFIDKSREVVSVKDFGATGDGVTNDTAALNAAATAAVGRTLWVPPGTYMVDGTNNSTFGVPTTGGWMLPSNTRVEMAAGAVIKVIPNGLAQYSAILISNADNVKIRGGSVVGDRATHTYLNYFDTLAQMNSGDYRTKRINDGTTVFPDGETGYVWADGANNGTYLRTAGAWAKQSGTLPNYFTHEFGFGIHIVGGSNVVVDGVRMESFTGDGLFVINRSLAVPATGIKVVNCTFDSNRRQGISLIHGRDIQISSNLFLNTGIRLNNQDGTLPRSGIDIESGDVTKADGVTISGNVFRANGASVIVFDGNNVTVTGNQIKDGPISYGFGANITVSGNSLTNAGITGNGARTTIATTYTRSGTTVTVTCASAHGLAVGNSEYMEFNDASGIPVETGVYQLVSVIDSLNFTVTDTTMVAASGSGTLKYTANNVSVTGNTVQGGQIQATGKSVNVQGNSIWNSVDYGVFVAGTSSFVNVSDNIINNCPRGIQASGASNVKVNSNQIKGSSISAISSSGTKTTIAKNHITYSKQAVLAQGGQVVIDGNYVDIGDYPSVGTAIQVSTARAEVLDNVIYAHTATCIFGTAPMRVVGNKLLRFSGLIGIQASGVSSDGSSFVRNVVEFDRTTTATSTGIASSGNTIGRVIENTIYGINALPFRAIDTSASATTRITNNTFQGAINNAASDTLTTNVAY